MKELSCIGRLNCTIQTRRRDEKLKYKKKTKKIFLCYCFIILLLCGMGMMGCSFQNPILGTWRDSGGEDRSITFYKDGTCIDSMLGVMSYKQQKDDVLMLKWGVGEQMACKRTDIISQALSDEKYYYLSGDEFVLYCNMYYQKIPMWKNVLPYVLSGMAVLGVMIILLYWKRDSSRPLMTKRVKILGKSVGRTNMEWYVMESENGERLKLHSFKAQQNEISVGDVGKIEYRGKTIQTFQKDD